MFSSLADTEMIELSDSDADEEIGGKGASGDAASYDQAAVFQDRIL